MTSLTYIGVIKNSKKKKIWSVENVRLLKIRMLHSYIDIRKYGFLTVIKYKFTELCITISNEYIVL